MPLFGLVVENTNVATSVVAGGLILLLCISKGFRDWLWPRFLACHRVLTLISFVIPFTLQTLIYWPSNATNASWFKWLVIVMWVPADLAFYYASFTGYFWSSTWKGLLVHFLYIYAVDWSMLVCVGSASLLETLLSPDRVKQNRLFNSGTTRWNGKKICVLGNGPSLVKGKPCGKIIDGMDEVVRFNNFQTKTSGLEEFTGTKCTVHFSDSMLFPSFPEYATEGATVCLALFMDRLMVSGSFFTFRVGVDLEYKAAMKMLLNPTLGWVEAEDIENLKNAIGISAWKHPTSGVLAIDWCVRNRPDPSVPVYIHGFDFFEGAVHYYDKTEPVYERLNDLLGVNTMHQPQKEKAFVAKLEREGKVKWIKEIDQDSDRMFEE